MGDRGRLKAMSAEPDRADDYAAIVQRSYDYAAGNDHRDVELFRSCFAESFVVDLRTLHGREPAEVQRDAWCAMVVAANGSFDATQHLISNHRVTFDGDRARLLAEVRASHWFSAETMAELGRPAEAACAVLVGHYDNDVVNRDGRWLISRLNLVVRFRTGDQTLFELARQRRR